MAIGGIGHTPVDIRHRRKGRVHQHDARRDRGVEMIVDLRCIEARDSDTRKEVCETFHRAKCESRLH
jgi:hypothetical protein